MGTVFSGAGLTRYTRVAIALHWTIAVLLVTNEDLPEWLVSNARLIRSSRMDKPSSYDAAIAERAAGLFEPVTIEELCRPFAPFGFRSVARLLYAGLLRQVSVDGTKTYFDTNVSAHHHFYLEHNHELVDIADPHLMLQKMPEVPDGYEIARVDMVVRLRKKR